MLYQEDRGQHAGLEALRERAQFRFGAEQVLYLVPPRNPEADETEFFRALAKRARMDPPAKSTVDSRTTWMTGSRVETVDVIDVDPD